MKIRAGFVSNSSSTSFLIISKRDLKRADFFELMGISLDSPIADLFAAFYQSVIDNIRAEVDFKTEERNVPSEKLFGEWTDNLSDHMLRKIQEARGSGQKVYFGRLDSETSPIQTFFCTDSFEVQNDKIYFNGLENVW
jgi:hypothetical protein